MRPSPTVQPHWIYRCCVTNGKAETKDSAGTQNGTHCLKWPLHDRPKTLRRWKLWLEFWNRWELGHVGQSPAQMCNRTGDTKPTRRNEQHKQVPRKIPVQTPVRCESKASHSIYLWFWEASTFLHWADFGICFHCGGCLQTKFLEPPTKIERKDHHSSSFNNIAAAFHKIQTLEKKFALHENIKIFDSCIAVENERTFISYNCESTWLLFTLKWTGESSVTQKPKSQLELFFQPWVHLLILETPHTPICSSAPIFFRDTCLRSVVGISKQDSRAHIHILFLIYKAITRGKIWTHVERPSS